MSLSLIAVFIPLLLMDGVMGRLFREFASHAGDRRGVLHDGVAHYHPHAVCHSSCSESPALPARADGCRDARRDGLLPERVYTGHLVGCWPIPRLMSCCLVGSVALSVQLYVDIPKGFFPQQDTRAPQRHLPRRPEHRCSAPCATGEDGDEHRR